MIEAGPLDQTPYLALHPTTHTLAVALPATSPDQPEWQVTLEFTDDTERTRTYPAGALPVLADVPAPFRAIHVAAHESLIDDRPYLVLDSAQHVVTDEETLLPAHYVLIAPRNTEVTGARACTPRELGPWPGYLAYDLDLHGVSEITIATPKDEPATLDVASAATFEWDYNAATLPNALTDDQEYIYTASPKLHMYGEGPWYLTLTYAPLGGEEELHFEAELEQGGEYEVFPSDAFDDPWVGRYKVELYEGEEVVDKRYVAIAEGLHMRAKNEGARGTDFRFMDVTGALSHFSYVLASPRTKPIMLEKGTRTFGASETSRRETAGTEAGYELSFDVIPETLHTRVAYEGKEPVSYHEKPVIDASQLDPEARLTVYSPRPLPLAKLVTIDPKQGIKNLVNTVGTADAVRSVAVNNKAIARGVKDKDSYELYLLWSELTYDEYLEELSARERASHERRSLEHRVMEYEAYASTKLIYAALATVKA